MLRHTVLFRWKAETSPEAIQAAQDGLNALPAQIPEIKRYDLGPDLGLVEGNYDFVLVADFDDEAAWRAYAQHPAHVAVVTEKIKPILETRVAVQSHVDG